MTQKILLWGLALLFTLASAVYQRKTGPTYPAKGTIELGGQKISYRFERSHGGPTDQPVTLLVSDHDYSARLHFKRFKTSEPFTVADLERHGDTLSGWLPHQPPAGRLEYFVELVQGDQTLIIPGRQVVVTRFKGSVPLWAWLSHALLMSVAMLWSNRAGLEAFSSKGKTKNLTLITVLTLLVGGMILGPVVQKYAFASFWTGVPFGWDLTDNKTLIAFVAWVAALWRHRANAQPRFCVIAAALITLAIFFVPHSMMGSELDYSTGRVTTGE